MSNLNYYQEIELIEQPDVSIGVIWSKLYTQLHLALADLKNKTGVQTIGISFPEYNDPNFPLGRRLRLFAATEKELNELAVSLWLSRLTDYVKVKDIHAVPLKRVRGYATFSRKEIKRNPEAIARRRARKDPGITYEEEVLELDRMGIYGAILGKALYAGKLDLRRVFYNGISATCSACRDDIKPLNIDTTKLTASDVSQYWHCKCGNLFIQLPDGRIIKLKTDEKPEKLPNLNLRHVTYLGIVPSCQDCRK